METKELDQATVDILISYSPTTEYRILAIASKLIISNITKGDLKYHFLADGTSPQYVTIPIAKKGIPKLYMNNT